MWRSIVASFAVLTMVQCGGGSEPGEEGLHVAGTYDVTLAYRSNTCTFTDPLGTLRVTVRHNVGAPALTLSDGQATFAASIDSTAAFLTTPLFGTDGRGNQLSDIQLAGHFTRTGFEADLGVNVLPPAGAACRYVITWRGRKDGRDNVIP